MSLSLSPSRLFISPCEISHHLRFPFSSHCLATRKKRRIFEHIFLFTRHHVECQRRGARDRSLAHDSFSELGVLVCVGRGGTSCLTDCSIACPFTSRAGRFLLPLPSGACRGLLEPPTAPETLWSPDAGIPTPRQVLVKPEVAGAIAPKMHII